MSEEGSTRAERERERERARQIAYDLEKQASWYEYRRLVISELERINTSLEKLNTELGRMKTDIALLQLKASVWGAVSGAVVAIGIILTRFIQ